MHGPCGMGSRLRQTCWAPAARLCTHSALMQPQAAEPGGRRSAGAPAGAAPPSGAQGPAAGGAAAARPHTVTAPTSFLLRALRAFAKSTRAHARLEHCMARQRGLLACVRHACRAALRRACVFRSAFASERAGGVLASSCDSCTWAFIFWGRRALSSLALRHLLLLHFSLSVDLSTVACTIAGLRSAHCCTSGTAQTVSALAASLHTVGSLSSFSCTSARSP